MRLRLIALAAIALIVLPAAAFASDIKYESKIEDGFGRLIITFPDRKPVPKYDARISNGVFILTFEEEADIALTEKPLGLDAYFSIVRRDADMKAFRFGLTRAVRVNTQVAAERLFIDFLPPTWVGLPPSLPPEVVAELAQRAEDALLAAKRATAKSQAFTVTPKLDLRIGRTPTFTRISFRWNVPFDANFTRSDDGVAIVFNRTDNPDLAKINVDPPPLLKNISKREIEDGMSLVLSVDPRAMVRAFRADDAYVVDLTSNAMQVEARDALAKVTPELLRQPDLGEMVVMPGGDRPKQPETGKAITPPAGTVAGRSVAAVPPAYANDHVTAGPPALPGSPAAAAGKPAASESEDAAPAVAAEEPKAATSESDHGIAVPAPPAESKPAPVGDAGLVSDLAPVMSRVVQAGATDQIVLPFGSLVASAIFRRGDDLWIVVDSSAAIDIEPIRAGLESRVSSVEHVPVDGGQALRLKLKSAQLVSAVQNGNEWLIALGDNVIGSTQRVDLVRGSRPDGKTILTADFRDAGAVHRLHDPTMGDDLIVVTGKGPARGLLVPQEFVELAAVPSAHGIVIAPRADDIEVTPAGAQVVIGRKNGLALSQLMGSPAVAPPPKGDPERPGFLNLKRWTALPAEDYVETVKELQSAISAANEVDRPGRRMQLADLYLSRQIGPETLGLLSLAAEENPALKSMIGYRLAMLAAEVMSWHAPEAWARANDEALAKDPDAALWRAIAGAPVAAWDAVIAASAPAESVVDNYPDFVQEKYLLALAEAQIERGQVEDADTTLTRFDRIAVSPEGSARRAMLSARVAEADGRTGDAAEEYKKAIAFGPGQTEAESEYRLVVMSYKAGLIPVKDAEARFETLSMTWRGDDLELKSLDQFTTLKVADKDYRPAFVAMRNAEHANGESPITEGITERMSGVFADLFLDGRADELQPVEALSLYYDFRELTPIGRRGDDMVRKLADRLISVDLLEQAAELLHHQIENRLRGAARAQIAADLAVVYLLDRRPTEALQIIRRTEQAQLPMLLDRQRRIVEARALADLKETRSALDLLSSMEGDDISRMRAEILWAANDWRGLAAQVERMMGGRWSDELPLNDRERRDVLRASIAYALADDALGLERIRKKYLAKMADGPDGPTFDAVTRPIEVESAEFKQIVKETAASDAMGAFLADYRARYLNGAPPATDAVVTSGIGG